MSAWGKSWGFAWGNSWGLLERPYVDLSTAEKIYVRDLLSAIYVREDVERIVALASEEQISILDAAETLVVAERQDTLTLREVVEAKREIPTPSQTRLAAPSPVVFSKELPAVLPVFHRQDSVVIRE